MLPSDIDRLIRHWRKFPPVRVLVAAAIDFEPQPDAEAEAEKKYMTADDLRALMAATGGRIPGMS